MADVGAAAALVLAVVLAWAALAKALHRPATAASFRGLGVPAPAVLAVVVPAVEAVIAVALLSAPAAAGWVALAVLFAFTVFIGRAVATGSGVPCACFGATTGRPVSALDLVRNAGLAALAVLATGAGPGWALWPSLPAIVAVSVVLALGRVLLGAVELRRTTIHVRAQEE